MIIQCRKCETRFRFDDSLIEGDGVWVRCSRCQEVFFQERPPGQTAPPAEAGEPEIPSIRISEARRIPEESFALADEKTAVTQEEQTAPEPSPVEKGAGEVVPEIDAEPSPSAVGAVMEEPTPELSPGDEEIHETEEPPEAKPEGRRWGRALVRIFAMLILAALIAGGVYLWLFPEAQQRVLESAAPLLREIPGMEKIVGTADKASETALAPIRLKDVRQRSMTNLLMGNLTVIEGIAVNQSPYPLAKIRIRLVISDAYDVVLGERIVYCGNILTDAELNTLAEAEILRELSTPQGTDVPNEKVAPNGGEIPFMIVFSQEQAGAIKTVVMPAGAERAK